MTNQPSTTKFTRRHALKTLATATGALALTQLPNKWETPIIEVGLLPAHAQISPTNTPNPQIGIRNLRITGPFAPCDAGNGTTTGDIYVIEFDYEDMQGQVIANQARSLITSHFPSSSTRQTNTTLGPTNIIGTPGSGTVNLALCVDFEGEAQVTITVILINATNVASEAVSGIINRP